MWLKKPMTIKNSKNDQWLIEKKWMFVNIMKRYPLNIFKKSQQSYLITKQKLNENMIIL